MIGIDYYQEPLLSLSIIGLSINYVWYTVKFLSSVNTHNVIKQLFWIFSSITITWNKVDVPMYMYGQSESSNSKRKPNPKVARVGINNNYSPKWRWLAVAIYRGSEAAR